MSERTFRGSTVIISGAGVAGLVVAYWLTEFGFRPLVVERAKAIRASGHAVDLWGSAVEIVDRMGIGRQLRAVQTQNATGITVASRERKATIALRALSAEIHPAHIELMRSHLITILAEAARQADFVFDCQIVAMRQERDGVAVELSDGTLHSAAMVVGADGVHSAVRRLAFGDVESQTRQLGAQLGNWTMSNMLGIENGIVRYIAPDRTIAAFPVPQTDRLGVIALDRSLGSDASPVDRRDRLARRFDDRDWPVPTLINGLLRADDFYADDIIGVELPYWHRGRIALIGDAGFAPGAAVGGGTGLAVLSAFLLSQHLRTGDVIAGLAGYSAVMRPLAAQSSRIGQALLDVMVPRSRFEVSATMRLLPVLAGLPRWVRRHLPLLPKPALTGLRAIAHYPVPGDRT